jgi:hypothetical protein
MKHIELFENFITDLFKKKKLVSTQNQYTQHIIFFRTNELVKRKKDGEIGRVFSVQSSFGLNELVYFVQFLDDLETNWSVSYYADELETPTDDEIELYKNTKNYNL